jgi:Holliday junction resolvase
MMNPDDISKLAFLLYPHIVKAPPDDTTVESLAERVRQLQTGLLPEDEFATIACWLGNCAGIHRIGQAPMPLPEFPDQMRAPDFIAFPIVDNRPFPVLIEVKSSRHQKIKWSERYRNSLVRFSEHLKLPLLVAWKHGGLWFLIDHRCFANSVTGYRLTLEQAFREDLSCLLFRSLRIQMNADLELILDMELLDEVAGDANTLFEAGPVRMEIKHAGFFQGGTEINTKHSFAFSLFLATPDQSQFRRTGKQTCQNVFRPIDAHGFSLSNVLVAQLTLGRSGQPLDWHRIITEPLPSSGLTLRQSLRAAIDLGFVRCVMDIVPNTWPDFLPDRASLLNNRDEA